MGGERDISTHPSIRFMQFLQLVSISAKWNVVVLLVSGETSAFFLFFWFVQMQILKNTPKNSCRLDIGFSYSIGRQRILSPFGASAAGRMLAGQELEICAEGRGRSRLETGRWKGSTKSGNLIK